MSLRFSTNYVRLIVLLLGLIGASSTFAEVNDKGNYNASAEAAYDCNAAATPVGCRNITDGSYWSYITYEYFIGGGEWGSDGLASGICSQYQYNIDAGLMRACNEHHFYYPILDGYSVADNSGAGDLGDPKFCPPVNPINHVTGNKIQTETDIQSNRVGGINFIRFYNSQASNDKYWTDNFDLYLFNENDYKYSKLPISNNLSALHNNLNVCTYGWLELKTLSSESWADGSYAVMTADKKCQIIDSSGQTQLYLPIFEVARYSSSPGKTFYSKYTDSSTTPEMVVSRSDGKKINYVNQGSAWDSVSSVNERLEDVLNATGEVIGWKYYTTSNEIEEYNALGKLLSKKDALGNIFTISYDAQGRRERIDSSIGEYLLFSYNALDQIESVTDHTGRVWGYRYDVNNNLEYVDNPDNTTKQYHYEDTDFPHALTGITDERGVRYSTYSYDVQGRANMSEHADGAQHLDIVYNADGARVVTNGRGVTSTYSTSIQNGISLVEGLSGPGCSTCGASNTSYTYDPNNNNLLSKTENDITIQYGDYDASGQYGYKIEAVGTSEERRFDYTYDSRYNNKITTKIEGSVLAGSNKITTYTYDEFANRTSVTVDGFHPDGSAVSRTTTYQYNGPLHQLSQIDGPRTDVSDVTTLDYYANDPIEGANRGRLQRITGPTGILLRDNIQYTATRKVLSEDRPNGVSLVYTYYPGNDRLETLTETSGGVSRVTRWTYLATGEVETITQAYGTLLATTTRLVYDDARRMVGIVDQLGNHIDYTLDTEGNRTDEKVFDSANVLYKSIQQTFDVYNRLDTRTLADEIIDYNYQPDGSLDDSINAKNVTTDFQYDALKRLTSTTGDLGGVDTNTQDTLTQYIYDAGDRLTSVISPNNSATTYSYDDLGNLLSETSPDRGLRSYTYDESGNVSTITDARGITVSYVYDALNRVTAVDYPGTAEDVSMVYDTAIGCANGVGKLCSVTDSSGVTTYSYDAFGNLAQEDKTELGVSYTTSYDYDAFNRVAMLTHPNGRTVDYGYDLLGRITSIDATVNGSLQTIMHNTQYRPDGLLTDMEFGNGFVETRLYNLKSRLTSLTMPAMLTNTPPTANAGTDFSTNENLLVSLDASASSDVEGPIASYAWLQVTGPAVTLSDAASIMPSFTTPNVSADTILVFQLTVSDIEGLTATDSVTVTVLNVNQPPLAIANADQVVNEGAAVNLDSTASNDPDGSIVSQSWVQTSGPAVMLNNPTTTTPSFIAPQVTVDTDAVFQLTVTDNDGATANDSTVVTIQNVNQLPVANAGVDQSVNEGDLVQLDGSGSADSDGTLVSYSWSQLAGPTVVLSNAADMSPSFTAPTVTADTVITLQLTVTDNDGASASDVIDVTVQNVNQIPVANISASPSVNEGDTLALDGSGSSDPDGSIVGYAWTQTAGPVAAISNSTSAVASITAPAVSVDATLTFQLTVTDNDGATAIASVNVQALDVPPTQQYSILNPRVGNGSLQVVSLVNNNTITAGNTTLTLNQYQSGTIPAVDAGQGTTVSGIGLFELGSNVNATDMPVPEQFMGTAFVIPHYRNAHTYYLLSPDANATATINIGTAVNTVSLVQGVVTAFNAGTDNSISGIVTADHPIQVSHFAGSADVYPVPPPRPLSSSVFAPIMWRLAH